MALTTLKEITCKERLPKRFFRGILDIIRDLKNPKEVLKLFSIRDAVSQKKHFLIIGSLIKAYPLKKHESSGTFIKVLILKGAISNDVSKFRVILFNDFAVEAETARLKEGDFLGFYEPSVVLNCAAKHTTETNLFKHQIVLGRQKTDDLLFFFMRKDPESIFEPPVNADLSSEQVKESKNNNNKVVKKTLKRYSEISYIETSDVKRNRNNSPSKPNNVSKSNESREKNSPNNSNLPIKNLQLTPKPIRTYETLSPLGSKSTVKDKDVAESVGVSNENQNTESISKDDVEVIECNENVTESSTAANKTSQKTVIILSKSGVSDNNIQNVSIVNGNYEYKKLNETHSFKEINSYAVVVDVLGDPRPCKGNKMSYLILVTDDSIFPKNFRIFIFYEPTSALSVQKHQILRFHRMKLEVSNGKIDGRVFNGWDVVLFDPRDIDQASGSIKGISCAKKCSFTEKDYEIIFKLKEWMDSMILVDLERELTRTEELVQKGCENLVLPANHIPSEAVVPKSREDFEKYLEDIDQNLVLVPELSQLDYNIECGFVCNVIQFHKVDDDRAALIVGDGQSCPLKLTSFPLRLPHCKTLDDCLKASFIKKNSLHISILLENISAKSVCEQLQNAKEIFISHCLTPKEETKEKLNLVIKCNLQVGDIILLDSPAKRFLKKFIRKPKTVNNQLKRKCEDSAPSPRKGAATSSDENPSKKKICFVNLEKLNLENVNGVNRSLENVITHSDSSQGLVNDSEAVNRLDDSVSSDINKPKDNEDYDPGKLASSQLSTCVTKLMKLNEGSKNARVIRAADAPDITKLKHQDKSIFFACMTNALNKKKKVEKETADINSLDEILSPMSRRPSLMVSNNETSIITNGSSPSHNSRNLNYSFDTNLDFEHVISASVISSPKSRKNLSHALSDVASETSRSSDETDIGSPSVLKNHVSPLAKFKISPHLSETSRVSRNIKHSITEVVPVPKKLSYEVQSQSVPPPAITAGSFDKSVSSPSKSNPVESSSKADAQEKRDFVRTSSQEYLSTSEQHTEVMRNEQESLSTIKQQNQYIRNNLSSLESLPASQDMKNRQLSPESISANKEEIRDLRKKPSSQESPPANEHQHRVLRKKTTSRESLLASEQQSRVTRRKIPPKESTLASEQQSSDNIERISSQESILISEQHIRDPRKISLQESLSKRKQPSQATRNRPQKLSVVDELSQDLRKETSSQESLSTEQHNRNIKHRLRHATANENESKKAKNPSQNLSQNSERKNRADEDEAENSANLDTSKYSSAKDCLSSQKPSSEEGNIDDAATVINLNVQQPALHSSTPLKNDKSAYTEAWIRTQNDSYDLDTLSHKSEAEGELDDCYLRTIMMDVIFGETKKTDETVVHQAKGFVMQKSGALNGNLSANYSRNKTISSEYFLLKITPIDEENQNRPNTRQTPWSPRLVSEMKLKSGDFIIIVGFCASGCKRYQLIKSFPGNMDSYVCKRCQKDGTNAKLSLRFAMRLHLVACKTGENVEALLTSPHAEIFLGCKIKNFVEDERIRTLILRNLKLLQINVPSLDENGVAVSQRLTLLLESKMINRKEQQHVIDFEVPKVFALTRGTL